MKTNFRIGRKPNSDIEGRFWEKVNKDGKTMPHMSSCCWEWLAAKDRYGYGVLNIGGKVQRAHRISYELNVGKIPFIDDYYGGCVCHKCNNPSCVNPSHLYVTDNPTNVEHARRDGLIIVKNHKKGTEHHNAKLNPDAVRLIRKQKPFLSLRKLGEMFGVGSHAISLVVKRKTWNHVD